MQKQIYPCLWFNGNAHEAATFYCSVFKHSAIISQNNMVTIFEINGTKFMALNAGPEFSFTEAISFVIDCETQAEIDYYWEKLTADGGKESMCGWLEDKYGVSWQVVPVILPKLLSNPDKAEKVIKAFMKMRKFDIAALENV